MKNLRTLSLALLAVLCFGGCLQQEKNVLLNPDGSGTVVETVVLGKAMLGQMKQMTAGLSALGGSKGAAGKPAADANAFEIMDEKKLRDAAGKMGTGVTFVSAKPVTTATGEGFTATYAFTDINQLKLDENPAENIPGAKQAGTQMGQKAKVEPVTFHFTKGSPSTLQVFLPQPKVGDINKAKPQMPNGGDEMAMMMMQQMFKDMHMALTIEVAGKIVQTNAEHHDGAKVTLMEMDFNKVLANPEKFKALSKAQPQTIEETKALVKGVDGIKVESQPEVSIKFK